MIADDREFELRREGEKILPHEPRRDRIAARELLDAGLSPSLAFFGFGYCDKPCAA